MRATLLTAQKMADSIVHEAEAKRDSILAQAEADARDRIAQLRRETEEAQERLRQGQQELARFIAASREICSKELSFLDQLPKLPVETAAPVQEAPVEEISSAAVLSIPYPMRRNTSMLRRSALIASLYSSSVGYMVTAP